jgi:hypothetical protein
MGDSTSVLSVDFLSPWGAKSLVLDGPPRKWWFQAERRYTRAVLLFTVNGYVHSIPAHFYTDGFSIPWGARWLYNRYGAGLRWAVVHDFLYACPKSHSFTKAESDRILYLGLGLDGASKVRKSTIYSAVRIGGQRAWDRYRREDV